MSELSGAESTETTAAPEATEATGESTETQPDLSKLEQRMAEQMEAMQRQIAEQFEQHAPQPDEDDEDDLLDPTDPDYEERLAEQQLNEWFEQRFQERMEPVQRQQMIEKRDEEFAGLLEEFPDLQDDKVRKPVLQEAQRLAQAINPDAVNRPEFVDLIEIVYKAQKADERAAQETPAGERKEVVLEGPGAAPAEPEEDLAARIVAASQRSSPLV